MGFEDLRVWLDRFDRAGELKRVKAEVNLADLMRRDGVPLTGGPTEFKALCVFHSEKNPSLTVFFKDGAWGYYCFGCGEKGDIFTLAMKLEGLSFPEAVEKLADLAGVPLPKDEMEDRGEGDRRKRLYALVARTAKLYADALRSSGGADARRYLQGRGIGGVAPVVVHADRRRAREDLEQRVGEHAGHAVMTKTVVVCRRARCFIAQ